MTQKPLTVTFDHKEAVALNLLLPLALQALGSRITDIAEHEGMSRSGYSALDRLRQAAELDAQPAPADTAAE